MQYFHIYTIIINEVKNNVVVMTNNMTVVCFVVDVLEISANFTGSSIDCT